MMSGGMMGSATPADMCAYQDLFNRHSEIRRTVVVVPGGIGTTTESDTPALPALLQADVSSMYSHLTGSKSELAHVHLEPLAIDRSDDL